MVAPRVHEVRSRHLRVLVEARGECGVQRADHRRPDRADDEVATLVIPLQSPDKVVGERLDGLCEARAVGSLDTCLHTIGHRVQHADGEAAVGAPGDLGGAENGGALWNVGVFARVGGKVGTRRRTPDAAGVERFERRDVAAEEAAEAAESEDSRALDEERALFRKEALEGREIHDRGVDLDLPEVGVEGRIEHQVGGEQILNVRTRTRVHFASRVERIAGGRGTNVARPANHVRHDLHVLRRAREAQAGEVSEARRTSALGLPPEGPLILLLPALDESPHLQPPRLHRIAGEAELRERDAQLRAPA